VHHVRELPGEAGSDLIAVFLGKACWPVGDLSSRVPTSCLSRAGCGQPDAGLDLPPCAASGTGSRTPGEAAQLLAALPLGDRTVWATVMYGGLRHGEIMALRWHDVDLAGGRIRVERSWDPKEGVIAPKSAASTRTVPIAVVLRDFLVEHKQITGREAGLVFGRSAETPLDARALARRAATAWKGREPISLHECRHTFASLVIAAGLNAKALSSYMGHSSITITLNLIRTAVFREPIGPLPKEWGRFDDPDRQKLHNDIIDARNELVAHSDLSRLAVWIVPAGVELPHGTKRDSAKIVIQAPRLHSERVSAIRDLCLELRVRLGERLLFPWLAGCARQDSNLRPAD